MLRRHFMIQSDDITYNKDDIVIQYKSDKHIKFFGDITEIISPLDDNYHISVKSDEYNNGVGVYIINPTYDNFYQTENLITIINGTYHIGAIGFVKNMSTSDIIYPTDDTIAIVTEITILNGGIHMQLFQYYKEFVKKITVKSNNFSYIPEFWCINYDSLEEIELGEGVIEIENKAFIQNTNLKYITLPSSVERIGYGIVNGTSNVEITYLGTKNQWNSIDKSVEWNIACSITVVHCTDGDIKI